MALRYDSTADIHRPAEKEDNMRYEILGGNLPVVVCHLESGESVITEGGSMSWMSPNMRMETTSGGGAKKVFSRMFSGENLFMNRYTAQGNGMIAFASSFPGAIKAVEITPDKPVIVQKRAFLAAENTVDVSIHFQKRIGKGLFGGEGFIMQKLSGHGIAFIEIDGYAVEYNLGPGQQIIVDTGYLAAMDSTCDMDIVTVPGAKNMLLGGEGFFNTVINGPGKVTLQTMPVNKVADSIRPYIPTQSN